MSVNQHELKGLQVQLAQAEALVNTSTLETKAAQKRETDARARVKSLQTRIREIEASNAEPIISEHAILRYLERVKGLNIEQLKQEIMDDQASKHIKFAKNGALKRPTHKLVFRNNVIVTVE